MHSFTARLNVRNESSGSLACLVKEFYPASPRSIPNDPGPVAIYRYIYIPVLNHHRNRAANRTMDIDATTGASGTDFDTFVTPPISYTAKFTEAPSPPSYTMILVIFPQHIMPITHLHGYITRGRPSISKQNKLQKPQIKTTRELKKNILVVLNIGD